MKKKQFTDQLGRLIEINFPPQRIISLVPSQTELLFDLGVADRIIGVTKFCIHPAESKSKPKVGGTKNFHFDTIANLKPDLIIGNKEENEESGIKQLSEKYPVWMSDILDWSGAMQMIEEVGNLIAKDAKAKELIEEIQNRFKKIKPLNPQKVLYLIWKKPWMAAGKNTFIDTMLTKAGLVNCLDEARYPELTIEKIRILAPEVILLSSEPFPFKEKHIEELQAVLPASKIVLVDGEMFSWYGSRLLHVPDYFASLNL
ncbi:iron ABC transporter [Cytophagales bacterium WSM2-2]|nr:iron ABC transporter [Cytophagales bacterium WSM2-2]